MSLYYRDLRGYIGDAASIMGWGDVLSRLEPVRGVLGDFVREGSTDDPQGVADAAEAFLRGPGADMPPSVKVTVENLITVARKAKDFLMVWDGTDDRGDFKIPMYDTLDAQGEMGRWITVRGRHLFIRIGQSLVDALEKVSGIKDDLDPDHAAEIEREVNDIRRRLPNWTQSSILKHLLGSGRWSEKLVKEMVGAMFQLEAAEEVAYESNRVPMTDEQHFSEVAQDLDRLESEAKHELQTIIKEMKKAVVKNLKPGQAVEDFKLPYFGEFRGAVKELMSLAHRAGGRDAVVELTMKHDVTIVLASDSFTPRDAMKWLREKEIHVAGVFGEGLTKEIKNILINALKVGAVFSDTVQRIEDLFLPFLGNVDEIEEGTGPRASKLNTLVRTVTTEAYNHGRLTRYRDPEVSQYLQGVRYSAVLDSRTTEVCRYLDGKVFEPDDPALMSLVPPNHFNCRSLLVPVALGEDEPQFITDKQKDRAGDLADKKFLSEEAPERSVIVKDLTRERELERQLSESEFRANSEASQRKVLELLLGKSEGMDAAITALREVTESLALLAENATKPLIVKQGDREVRMEIKKTGEGKFTVVKTDKAAE